MSQRKPILRPWRWRVRELAEEKGLSMSEIARRAGVSRSTIQAFCHDPQHETTTAMWARLARALEVSLAEMLDRVSESEDSMRDHE
ncbi:MAG: helix-turn-helix domain-containing protein [Ktedonobacteraceae bacterium]